MLAIERRRRILDEAARLGTVKTHTLAQKLGVTEETVRRDLDELAKRGQLDRTHGGAMDLAMKYRELPARERQSRQVAEKAKIARKVVAGIRQGEVIMVDASSTVLELVKILPEGLKLRVLAYGMDVVEKLGGRTDLEIILLGGQYEARGRRLSGLVTEMAMRCFRIDRFYFSGAGFDEMLGVGEPNPEEARLKAGAIAQANWCCAMLDKTKFGRKSEYYFAKPSEIDQVVSEG